jgi:hypothetical protein
VQALRDMVGRAAGLARGAQGYLAGFGTSGSLLAVAVLLFVVASAMVAFHGWPHVGAQPSPGEVVVSPRPTAGASPVSRRLARFVAPAALRAGKPAGGRAARGVAAAPSVGRTGATAPLRSLGRPLTASVPARTPGGSSGSSCAASGCGSSPAPAQPARPALPAQPSLPALPGGAGSGPTQPIQQVVKQTSSAVGGVVSRTGQQVGSVVQQTSGAVAGVVQPVSPQAVGVINGAGAAKTVTGETQTVAGALSGLAGH